MVKTIKDIALYLGIEYQEVLSQVQEYETNDLTPEMDGESFRKLLDMICDDQAEREWMSGGSTSRLSITRLSNYYGHTYGELARPFSSETVIENVVPFLVVNKWFKVFYIDAKQTLPYGAVTSLKDYLIVGARVKPQQVEEHFKKLSSSNMFEIISLKEIIV